MAEKVKCPCCGYKTLSKIGNDEICKVCFWHDDGQNDSDADDVRGGPNYELSLSAARINYKRIGASSEKVLRHVRKPLDSEL